MTENIDTPKNPSDPQNKHPPRIDEGMEIIKFHKQKILSQEPFKVLKHFAQNPLYPKVDLELESWDEFCQLLQPITHVGDKGGVKSPTMPICWDKDQYTVDQYRVTAIANLEYPTRLCLLIPTTEEDIKAKIQFLQDCGYAIIKGFLSWN